VDYIIVGSGTRLTREPESAWRQQVTMAASTPSPRLEFMTREHHLVRDTVVVELPRRNAPLSPKVIANETGLAVKRVEQLLDELEARLFFLVRNADGDVSWAYPVTAEPTPHRLRFESGESVFAA
jgi:hypothetical protein